MKSIFDLEQSKLLEAVNKSSPDVLAAQLFCVSAEKFANFNLNDNDSINQTTKAMNELAEKTQKLMQDSILSKPTPEILDYWLKVMEKLIEKGDYSTSTAIFAKFAEIASIAGRGKNEALQKAFENLQPDRLAVLEEMQETTKRIDKLTFYTEDPKKTTTIPYMGLYPKILEFRKDAATLDCGDGGALSKLKCFTSSCQAALKEEATKEIKSIQTEQMKLTNQLEQYQSAYSDPKSSIEQQTLVESMTSLRLVETLKHKSIPATTKVDLLDNFIRTTAQTTGRSAATFVIDKITQDLKEVTSTLAPYEQMGALSPPAPPSSSFAESQTQNKTDEPTFELKS